MDKWALARAQALGSDEPEARWWPPIAPSIVMIHPTTWSAVDPERTTPCVTIRPATAEMKLVMKPKERMTAQFMSALLWDIYGAFRGNRTRDVRLNTPDALPLS
jgi:hypothetical protein